MEPFTCLDAIAAPLALANVDTDQIVPSRFLRRPRSQGYADYLFRDLRFAGDGAERPDFVLNRPLWRAAHILITLANFGCGSSREQAVYALWDYGFRAVIAPSFGEIFHGNAMQNGLLLVRLETAPVTTLIAALEAEPGSRMLIDLDAQQVGLAKGPNFSFDIDPFRKDCLLRGQDEIGLTQGYRAQIDEFERRMAAVPWL